MEPIRVFIVEDDPMVANINQRFAEKLSAFKVVGTASTETEALQQILHLQPDLVLLDIYLTQGSGLNILKQIRLHSLPTDIILVTAAKDTSTIHETLRYGAVDYLIKPFDMERLHKALRNYQKLRQTLSGNLDLSQTDLDQLSSTTKQTRSSPVSSPTPSTLPKGVHQFTLDQIHRFLGHQNQPLSCQQIASGLSMSKITIWRYLEYLVEVGKVKVDLEYGTVGRPTKLYRTQSVS